MLTPPLRPFVDPLPAPPRLIAREHDGRLSVRMRTASHRFHRALPASRVWAYEGSVPGHRDMMRPIVVMPGELGPFMS